MSSSSSSSSVSSKDSETSAGDGQDDRSTDIALSLWQSEKSKRHHKTPRNEQGRHQQADNPEPTQKDVGEPGAYRPAHIFIDGPLSRHFDTVGRVVRNEGHA